MAAMKVAKFFAYSNITVSNTERNPKSKYVSITLRLPNGTLLLFHKLRSPNTRDRIKQYSHT